MQRRVTGPHRAWRSGNAKEPANGASMCDLPAVSVVTYPVIRRATACEQGRIVSLSPHFCGERVEVRGYAAPQTAALAIKAQARGATLSPGLRACAHAIRLSAQALRENSGGHATALACEGACGRAPGEAAVQQV